MSTVQVGKPMDIQLSLDRVNFFSVFSFDQMQILQLRLGLVAGNGETPLFIRLVPPNAINAEEFPSVGLRLKWGPNAAPAPAPNALPSD